ncbi:nucleoside 2-deoxyribosyltransferase [Tumebacillus sp. BK434]|uniref:DUF4062 domain-containing protein n=1 Tax=Tumebacillus sp. BK434 TaxID=2512169 RepID=UPI0010EA21D2|nr:DUF4062 domain-containing protein [Tumebacillus sp. BK434]TCP50999.1 nucleoside 2-deoxyribosyltransferase [Tumebacillus sp. BK434]
MANPKVFISSTFYDLHQVRKDVAVFIQEYGFDHILFEDGQIPYGAFHAPAESCYEEVDLCDILISIIGGRLGSSSAQSPYSVSQAELRRALEKGKQVYIFIAKSVHTEYETYKVNKDNNFVMRFADDPQVYEFLSELYDRPKNNAIFSFETSQDMINILRKQWAGLFHRLLSNQQREAFPQTAGHPAFEKIRSLLSGC